MHLPRSLKWNTCKPQRENDKCINAVAQDYMYLWKYTNKDDYSRMALFNSS